MNKREKIVYCHFTFCKKGDGFGYFAVGLFWDHYGNGDIIYKKVYEEKLWSNEDIICDIQAYECAMRTVSTLQGYMKKSDVNRVILVTHNYDLSNWLKNNKESKKYFKYIERANVKYRFGEDNELIIPVGVGKSRKTGRGKNISDIMQKYCSDEYVERSNISSVAGKRVINIESIGIKNMSDFEHIIINETPEITGVNLYKGA